jgi:exodeoxyribonuclease VIII
MNLNLPFADYLAAPGYGSGAIRQFIRSPSHFQHYIRTGGEPPSPAQVIGSATHCAVLEPREFNNRYAVAPDVDRRTKIGKEAWEIFSGANQGKEILAPVQHQTAYAIRDTLLAMPEYRNLIYANGDAQTEVSEFWVDPATGIELKARADILLDGIVVDLKTAADASPRGFAAACARYGYEVQAAMYCEAFKRDRFVFVAVENKPPFAAGVYRLDDASLELGRQKYRKALEGIAECERSATYPVGYGEQELSLPAWAFWENEEEIEA